MAVLSFGYKRKSITSLPCFPGPEMAILKGQNTGGTNGKYSKRREDALTHFAILPGYHSVIL